MMKSAVHVSNLIKTYRIYGKPSDRLKSFFSKNVSHDTISALDDITFSVNRAETFGIIGENGAGKSTLLKVLTGVVIPTSGQVEVNGQVLSILELGVGFHPEFTGRENIFYYGDVLGFSRDFIRGKLEEIVDFSELGPFIDKPVRTYSTGMMMRLAFSIVSSFEPEVLILDEVLAVGDLHFQRKSLNRILDFKKKGGTILFCSHDTYHIRMICDNVLWLKDGRIEMLSDAEKVVLAYESYQFKKDEHRDTEQKSSASLAMIEEVRLLNDGEVETGGTLSLFIRTSTQQQDTPYHVTVSVKLPDGRGVYVTGTHLNNVGFLRGPKTVTIEFPSVRLLAGNYYAHIRVFDETGLILYHERATPFFNVGKKVPAMGICLLDNTWKIV